MKLSFSLTALVLSILLPLIHVEAKPRNDTDGRRPLEHEDYDRWNSINGTTLTQDGEWLMYSLRDGKDQNTLKIHHLESKKEYTVKRGTGARFSFDAKYAAYRISPDPELIKKLKKEKKKKDLWPQERFEILNLENGSPSTMDNVQSFSMPEENGTWIAILLKKSDSEKTAVEKKSDVAETYEVTPEGLQRPRPQSKKSSKKTDPNPTSKARGTEKPMGGSKSQSGAPQQAAGDGKKSDDKKKKDVGTTLVLRNLETGIERRIPHVARYRFSRTGKYIAFVTSTADKADRDGVHVIDLERDSFTTIVSGLGNYKNLAFDESGRQLTFITDRDDYESKTSSWSLYHWKTGLSSAKKIAAEGIAGIPEEWWLSSSAAPFFSENGRHLYFYTAPKRNDVDEEDEDPEPAAKLDLWHWQDPLLQPQQLLQAAQERRRSYVARYHISSRKIVQLANPEIPDVFPDARRKSNVILGTSDVKYKKMVSWDLPGFRDAYLIDAKSGQRQRVLERIRSRPQLSPEGKYLLWWDTDERQWLVLDTAAPKATLNLSASIPHPLYNELHDTPSDPGAYGVAAWCTNDDAVLIYDRFDIWKLDPTGKEEPVCLTLNRGREQSIRFRYRRLDRDARAVNLDEPLILTAFNEKTKESGFFQLDINPVQSSSPAAEDNNEMADTRTQPQQLILLSESLGGLQKAKGSDTVVFTRSTFRRFPDVWASTTAFKEIKRVSRANPHQREYLWGTVELTSWTASDGQPLDGLLYKPDDFDADQKYPLLVYFYERNSDNLHRHYIPAAGRSIINFSYYVSRGYVVFVPDIPYKTGEPGPSAANAVLPGVQHVVDQGFIDPQRIGTQGHSWGGYQTAYLVTQSDIFACAESGAPVSNMTSAYGGIRWSSGMSRMFQYERTQSRIGDTLWNAREKYIANSPLFFVDKINTPLLILHNDEDGAVPWYQGIELFVAMRRLEKPAWLLNYNGNPHWVMGRENRLDFARRMQQFFDHYLKGEALPQWMATGIPAVDKGKEFGFDEAQETVIEHEEVEEKAVSDR